MATKIVADTPVSVLLTDEDRRALCLESVIELDAIGRALPRLASDEDQGPYLVRAMAGRMLRLTHALMHGLSQEAMTNDQLRQIVHFDEAVSRG